MDTYNIFTQTQADIKDFFETKIKIGGATKNGKIEGGYEFSQWDTLQNIEYIDASRFLSGDRDSEKQQKFYLNIATFRREVASKNIDIDVANFKFIPEEGSEEFGAYIARKKFRKWAKEQGLSKMLNESVERLPKYGSIVMKKVGKEIEIVPLLKLRNQQDAECLEDARYVIIEHSNMTKQELEENKGWDVSKLDMKPTDTVTVYERYSYVPKDLDEDNSQVRLNNDTEMVYKVVIHTLDKGKGKEGGAILFAEETECPFIENHYAQQDGRWLGIGEMEKQFENQAARNMVFNLRKKSLAWSSKNIFGTTDDLVVNNLVKQVKDGDVVKMSQAGGLVRIDTDNRASGDYNSLDQLLEENSNQRSFTFESATGESFKSGTPFRLGALLTDSVNSYYDKKKENLGIFWKEVIEEFMLDQWIKETEEEFIEGVADTEEGFEMLRDAKKELLKGKYILRAVLDGQPVNMEAIDLLIETVLAKLPNDYYRMTKEELKSLKYKFDIDVTGESINIPQKVETLTTLYQTQLQSGDMNGANATLKRIMSLTGEPIPRVKGSAMTGMGGAPTQMPTGETNNEQRTA